MFNIGSWAIKSPAILAPMAGVTDEPFRHLCRRLGAGMTTSEMVTADASLWHSRKSQQRLIQQKTMENEPRSIQLTGNEPEAMARAAQLNEAMGAQIIDINMGCPAKKVCKKAAGSALLRDEKLVAQILQAVVHAVTIPVTLKIRTGWSPEERNGLTIAQIAEDCGISALAVHGRTRACAFKGKAEYDTIADIVERLSIPVFANGDITTPQQAEEVLKYTHAQAVMVGRAAQGNPWIFREINHYLMTRTPLAKPTKIEVLEVLSSHLQALHSFYGKHMGVKIARKHIGWYLKQQVLSFTNDHEQSEPVSPIKQHEVFRQQFNRIESAQEQYDAIQAFFERLPLTINALAGEIAA